MTTVHVNPELIRWAIDRSGLSTEELEERFPKLPQWANGERQPTFRQLEAFARKTTAPFGAMFLKSPPRESLPLPDFRTLNDAPLKGCSPNLLDTIHLMQQRQAWMRQWLVEEGAPPLDFVGAADTTANVKALARQIRERLGLEVNWAESLGTWEDALKTLRRAIERSGVIVFSSSVVGLNNHRPLDPQEFRGFVLCDPFAPVMFLNDADTKSARIFTLAHELAHVWLGEDSVFNLERLLPAKAETERFCNRVAAEMLVPEDKLKQRYREASQAKQPFHQLARIFKVSPVVAARRALDLRLITKPEFFRFYEQDQADWHSRKREQRKKAGGGDFYATQNSRLGGRFSEAVVRAAREGRMLYQDAYRLTGLSGTTFQTYADQVLQRVRAERE